MTQPPEPPGPGDQGEWPGPPPQAPYGPGAQGGYGGYAGPPGPPQGPPPGGGYEYGYPPPGTPTTNGKATASLVVGISSLVLSWCCGLGLAGIAAIVLGVKARTEIRASHGTQEGDGMALAGIVTGAIAVVLGLLVLILIVVALAAGSSFEGTTTYGTEL